MYVLYRLTNTVNGKVYFGITNNFHRRMFSHKSYALTGKGKTPLANAIRKYGWDAFTKEVLLEGTKEQCGSMEQTLIEHYPGKTYNLHPGGGTGFSILTKSPEEVEAWRIKLRVRRAGKTPAAGMKHTKETKLLCGDYGKLRWDIYGRFDAEEILSLGCTASMKKFGISKTHYYRLKKQALINKES